MGQCWFVAYFFVVITLIFTSPNPTLAGEALDNIVDRGELVVGTSPEYPPLSFKDKDGSVVGFEPTLARIIAGSMGVKLKIVEMNFHDLLPALHDGKLDMVLSAVTMTPGRNMHVAFVGPYLTSGQNILAHEDKVRGITNITDMNNPDFTLAVNKGTTGEATAKDVLPKANIKVENTLTDALQLVLDGKADAVMADDPYLRVMALKYKGQGLTTSEVPFTFEPFGIAIPANDSLYINWLRNFMLTLEGSGRLEALVKTWYGTIPRQMSSRFDKKGMSKTGVRENKNKHF